MTDSTENIKAEEIITGGRDTRHYIRCKKRHILGPQGERNVIYSVTFNEAMREIQTVQIEISCSEWTSLLKCSRSVFISVYILMPRKFMLS